MRILPFPIVEGSKRFRIVDDGWQCSPAHKHEQYWFWVDLHVEMAAAIAAAEWSAIRHTYKINWEDMRQTKIDMSDIDKNINLCLKAGGYIE